MLRGLTAEINTSAARANLAMLSKTSPVIAVVKADAYGHGAVEMARVFVEAGARMLAVAFVSEARELRESGIRAPILVLFDRTEPESFFDLDLTPVIHDLKTAQTFSSIASKRNRRIGAHIKVDTGMGRMGIESMSPLTDIASLEGIEVTGLMTHLSDADLADDDYTSLQIERFNAARDILSRAKPDLMCHMANSAATLSRAEARFDAVRPGLALYGVNPFGEAREGMPGLMPVMKVTAGIVALRKIEKGAYVSYGRTFRAERPTLSAVLAAGYADGFMRAGSGRARTLVRGSYAPVMGRICMDLTMVDVTDIPGVADTDRVTLLGRDGGNEITAWEAALHADTIAYETLLNFGKSAQRIYTS